MPIRPRQFVPETDEVELSAGDGAAIGEQAGVRIAAIDEAEVLLFDLA